MFTEHQILYLEEVLGTSPDHYRRSQTTVRAAAPPPAIVVFTPPLGEPERELLARVLGSIQLGEYLHVDAVENLPIGARHILAFEENYGRRIESGVTWWGLPALGDMLGAGPAVNTLKKRAWALLQQFARERAL